MTKRKVWRANLYRTETWSTGRFSVIRARNGRFITSHKIRTYRKGAKASSEWTTGARARLVKPSYPKLIEPTGKVLSIYGKVLTPEGEIESRRWEIAKGELSASEWQKAVGYARDKPPKHGFNKRHIFAKHVKEGSSEYDRWVMRPEIESR